MKNNSRIDLTEGPIFKTLIGLAVPVTISMVMFTVYLMVDLYFVARLGPDAVAAVSIKYFGGSGKSLEWGIQYFQIFVVSFLFMILLYTIGNCYRGMGNTKTPMIIMLQANLMNTIELAVLSQEPGLYPSCLCSFALLFARRFPST